MNRARWVGLTVVAMLLLLPAAGFSQNKNYIAGLKARPAHSSVYLDNEYEEHGVNAVPVGVTDDFTGIGLQSRGDHVVVASPGWNSAVIYLEPIGWRFLGQGNDSVQHSFSDPVILEPATFKTRWERLQEDHAVALGLSALVAVVSLPLGAWSLIQYGRRKAGVHVVESHTLLGRVFDGYRLTDELGQGAFAHVYRADVTATGEQVAVKVLKSEYLDASASEALTRFHRETRVQMLHLNVVKLFGFGEFLGRPYLVMELIHGVTLRAIMTGPVPLRQALPLFLQMCEGLSFAHKRGFVHRDLKPENVMLTNDGVIKVMDFGIAKHLENPGATRSALTMGTPRYMSPEQVDSSKTDTRSDIYTMGIILFEMLTGDTPFDGDVMALITAHITEPPPKLRDIDAELPVQVELIVDKMLQKDRDDRYPTVDAVIEAITVSCVELGIASDARVLPPQGAATNVGTSHDSSG